eukprot:s443_g50.t1
MLTTSHDLLFSASAFGSRLTIFQLSWHFQGQQLRGQRSGRPMALSNHGMKQQIDDALSTIEDVLGNLRRLQTTENCDGKVDLEDPHNIAQIIQGAMFIVLAMWLIFANNSKVAVAQRAPLEQRHAVCATISTAVALFSGFFNILQLTAIDDFDLPGRENNFSLNLSRPVEWIATCPIMQLKLVVLAGARVPSYRRFMMPLLSVAVLLCGTASMFTGDALRFGWYGFGLCLASIMFYHNILQISENSEGEENAFQGDSDFRKLSLLLIITWIPFPVWFSLSIEGFGVITDYLIIEMGWVVLNIISKFTFIILMQRMKMVHQRKLEAARELYGLSPTDEIPEDELKMKAKAQVPSATGGVAASTYGLGVGEEAESEEKMVEVVAETMVTLGMSAHTDRMLRLLVENGVTNTAVLERLTGERCMELNLPWVLVEAAQKRWTAEKMNLGQDKGGLIEKEDPFMKLLEANRARLTQKEVMMLPNIPGTPASGMIPVNLGHSEQMEDLRGMMYEVLQPFREEVLSKLHSMEENMQRQMESSQEAIAQRMDFSQVAILQTVNACQVLLHKLDSSQDSVMQKVDTQKIVVDNLLTTLTGQQLGAGSRTHRAFPGGEHPERWRANGSFPVPIAPNHTILLQESADFEQTKIKLRVKADEKKFTNKYALQLQADYYSLIDNINDASEKISDLRTRLWKMNGFADQFIALPSGVWNKIDAQV